MPLAPRPAHALVCATLLAGCCPIEPADYRPEARDDWEVSTPRAEGLDSDAVHKLYCGAARRDELYGLLVVKNGKLVAEAYFNEGHIDEHGKRASVTKSYVSAMVGAALDDGCLDDLDRPMMDFFPQLVDDIEDPRKFDITVRHLLQMRSGYPPRTSTATTSGWAISSSRRAIWPASASSTWTTAPSRARSCSRHPGSGTP